MEENLSKNTGKGTQEDRKQFTATGNVKIPYTSLYQVLIYRIAGKFDGELNLAVGGWRSGLKPPN